MSPSSTQQWTRRIRYADQHIRVSDADRNAVAEQLGVHYADGRLDQAEFDERISRTMAAKTRGDLAGLFDDLPDPGLRGPRGRRAGRPRGPVHPARRRSGFCRSLVVLAIVALLNRLARHDRYSSSASHGSGSPRSSRSSCWSIGPPTIATTAEPCGRAPTTAYGENGPFSRLQPDEWAIQLCGQLSICYSTGVPIADLAASPTSRMALRYATATASNRRCSSAARSNGTRSGRCDSTTT